MLTFLLNGEPQTRSDSPSIEALIEELGLTGKRIAVECNGVIVPKSQHKTHRIESGDRVELVAAVGGG
jgi:sulfur carrier protein